MRRKGWMVLVGLAFGGWSSPAVANPWDLFGFNARAQGMGGAHTAAANDFTAVYYNPAGLTASADASFGFGYNLTRPQLDFRFEREDRSVSEVRPPSGDGMTFGALFPVGNQGGASRLAIGLGLHVPTSSLLSGQALDPAIPQWYMYQSLPRRIVAALGVGARPWDFISFGLSLQILAGVVGRIDYELDIVSGQFNEKTVTFDIDPNLAPIAGIEIRPWSQLRLGLVYRAPIEADVDLPVDVVITGVADLLVTTLFSIQYTPHQFHLGASYEFVDYDLSVALDLTYALWSLAPDPSVTSELDVGGSLFEGTGLDEGLDAPAPGRERAVVLGFSNILMPRIGVEKRWGPFSLRTGYAIRPSPAPLQTSGANYVDGTSHVFSLGAGIRLADPLGLLSSPLAFDVSGATHWFPARRHDKANPQDPVGGYEASGAVWVLGISARYAFGVAPADATEALDVTAPRSGASL